MIVSTLTVNRVKFSAKVEKKLSPAIGKSSMCHVYSNGGINNSKKQPKAKSAALLTLALKSMFWEEKGVTLYSVWPGQ